MLAWIGARTAGLWGKAMFALGFIVAALTVALNLVSIGRRQERGAQAERDAQAARSRREVDNEIDGLGAADVDARLRDRWMRPD